MQHFIITTLALSLNPTPHKWSPKNANWEYTLHILWHIGETIWKARAINISAFTGVGKTQCASKTQCVWSLENVCVAKTLEAFQGQQYGVVWNALILSRLTPEWQLQWARDGEQRESDLVFLLNFLQREIERQEPFRRFSREGATADDWTSTEKCSPIYCSCCIAHISRYWSYDMWTIHIACTWPMLQCHQTPMGDWPTRHANLVGECFRCLLQQRDMHLEIVLLDVLDALLCVPKQNNGCGACLVHHDCGASLAQPCCGASFAQNDCGACLAQPFCGASLAQPSCDASLAQPFCGASLDQPGSGASLAQPGCGANLA